MITLCSLAGCTAATDISESELAAAAQQLAGVVACPTFAACFTVTNTNNAGAGSLRKAILDANAASGATFIYFDIPGAGPHVIRPLTYLPLVQGSTTIDGFSQPGALAGSEDAPPVLQIVIDGELCFGFCNGLALYANDNVVRGLVINDFSPGNGIAIESDDNVIQGNILGTGHNMLTAVPNAQAGVNVNSGTGNLIGGDELADRNVISGNGVQGVLLFAGGNQVYGNSIGMNFDASLAIPNGGSGVEIHADDNDIGAVDDGYGNVIAHNGGDGITVVDGVANTFSRNAIHHNGKLAVDLGADGVTPNDGLGDLDVGPNGRQNFPVIESIVLHPCEPMEDCTEGYRSDVTWLLRSVPNHKFRAEFFANTVCDDSGRGEARQYLTHHLPHTTDETGLLEVVTQVNGRLHEGEHLTMLATDLGPAAPDYGDGTDSSELSQCVQANF